MKKYEITDIAHPDNPNLHRIRAVTDLNEDVLAGMVGGYVESYDNLDQEGRAWISADAIACENAVVCGDAVLTDHAVAKGCAYVGNNAMMTDHAIAQDDAAICGGLLTGESCVCGYAVIRQDEQTLCAPIIDGSARVYGEISGNVFAAAMPLSCLAPSWTTGRRTALYSKMTVFLCRRQAVPRPRKNPVPMILNDKKEGCL